MKRSADIPWKLILRKHLAMFIPLAAMVFAISAIMHQTESKSDRLILENIEAKSVAMEEKIINNKLNSIGSDLIVLAEHAELKELLASVPTNRPLRIRMQSV